MKPKNCWRSFSIDRAKVNAETGEFRAVVFTDGEASDGHILSIEGAQVPERMPLFADHHASVRTQLGSLYPLERTAHQIVMRGEIFLGGEGPELEIRRDILAKMAAGHVSQMSGRWDYDEEDAVRRSELPEDHAAYVSPKKAKKDWRYRWGHFFKRWRAQEGSLVGLGADPAASVRDAMRFAEDEAASPAVRAFWRSQAEAVREREQDEPITRRDFERFTDDLAEIIRETIRRDLSEQLAAREDAAFTDTDPTDEPDASEATEPAETTDAGDEPDDARATQAPAEAGAERSEEPAPDPPARESQRTGRASWDPSDVAVAIQSIARRRNKQFTEEFAAVVRRAQGKLS